MKTTIHRFKLTNEAQQGMQQITMPNGARILSVGFTGTSLSIWALVKVAEEGENAEMEDRQLEIFRTGQELTATPGARREFIASVVVGPIHIHIFEWIAIEDTKATA